MRLLTTWLTADSVNDVLRSQRMPLQLRHFLGCYYLATIGFDE